MVSTSPLLEPGGMTTRLAPVYTERGSHPSTGTRPGPFGEGSPGGGPSDPTVGVGPLVTSDPPVPLSDPSRPWGRTLGSRGGRGGTEEW